MKTLTFLLCILIATSLCAQDVSKENLAALQDEELLELFNQVYTDSIKAEKVARTYLNRARAQEDTIKMARGYDRLARIFHPEKNLRFADSVIVLTEHTNHITYPALGYILKATNYYEMNNLELVVMNYLLAYRIAENRNNTSQQVFVMDNLVYFKAIWGNPFEALKLQRKRHEIVNSPEFIQNKRKTVRKGVISKIGKEYTHDLILSYESFSFCFLNMKELDSARFYTNKAYNLVRVYDGFEKEYHKILLREYNMQISFYDNKFKETLKYSDSLLKSKTIVDDPYNLKNVYFFKGLAHLKLGEQKKGFSYLLLADSIYDNSDVQIVMPYQRKLFEQLYYFNDSLNNRENKIIYLNKMLRVDSVLKKNYRFYEPNLIKKFETPRLLKEKENLIAGLEKKQKVTKSISYWYLLIAILSLTAFLFYYGRQRIYKQRYENLIAKQTKPKTDITSQDVVTSISTSIISDILTSLEQFESKQEYLSQNISLTKLAKTFGTNSNYLSKVINLKMEKSFPQYINDLRVDYAAEELRTNRQFRRFTIKAIAEDCGFRSAESFSKAFYKSHGIYPSYYIKKLNKKNEGL